MVQLVFVHGVATRSTAPGFQANVANRDTLLKTVAFAGGSCDVTSPVWGDDAQSWAWNEASLPTHANRQTIESFSLGAGLAANDGATGDVLASMAKVDRAAAVDTLFAIAVAKANAESRALSADELSDFRSAVRWFGGDQPDDHEPRLTASGAQDDEELVGETRTAIQATGSFGVTDYLRDAAAAVLDGTRNLVSTGLVDLFRDDINPAIARFVGDILVYLKPGPHRTRIRADVEAALIEAWNKAQANSERLVLIGHSLGGVILYDLLTDPSSTLPQNFKADLFVSVGSQVGVFEEFKIYDSSSPEFSAAHGNKVALKERIGSWMNVFDPVDVLSFRCAPIFEGAIDYTFSSGTGLTSAHTAYFGRPRFYARLRARAKQLAII